MNEIKTKDSSTESRNYRVDEGNSMCGSDQAPLWKREGKIYDSGVLGLHEEIIDFVNYVCPSPEEHWVREIVVAKVKNVIYSTWRHCQVDVFGSFSTGLYLPTSDIDVVIFGKWPQLPLGTLEHALQGSKFATDIKVLSKATVPIVKFTDSDTGLRVDISFNMNKSVCAVEFVRTQLTNFPCLRYLVFTLKQFLLLRELNEVWTGGISSYALILMCISFLQLNLCTNETANERNLGTLLLEFFEFYGTRFNYKTTGIRFSERGSFVSKDIFTKSMENDHCLPTLCIDDPLSPGNNVARRSYSSLAVLQAFKHAYYTLSNALIKGTDDDESVLSSILHVSPATLESRKRVRAYAVLMYQVMPQFFMPRVINRKCGSSPMHLQNTSQKLSSQPVESSDDQLNSGSSSKEQIIVSARGLSTRPPSFLRAPNGADMLLLSQNYTNYGYIPNPVFYDPVCFPLSAPIHNGASSPPKSVFVILSHSAFGPVPGQYLPPHSHFPMQTLVSPVDGETGMVAPHAMSDSASDCGEPLSDPELSDRAHLEEENVAESQSTNRCTDPSERNFKICRSVSVSDTCSALVSKLAPLKIFSSEGNVCCPQENQGINLSCPLSSFSVLPSSSSPSSTKSKELKNCERMEADLPHTPPPPPSMQAREGASGSKPSRRRRRLLRKNGGATSAIEGSTVSTSTLETQSLPARTHGFYLSSNDEAEDGCTCRSGFQTKRRCCQLHSVKSSRVHEVDGLKTIPDAARGNAKAWPSYKPSSRMDSVSPVQNTVANVNHKGISKGGNKNESSIKSGMVSTSLKRPATSRARSNRA